MVIDFGQSKSVLYNERESYTVKIYIWDDKDNWFVESNINTLKELFTNTGTNIILEGIDNNENFYFKECECDR